ncbi:MULTISPECIES: hypothetical protein [Streptosporangium]|uniref:Crotonobetainyl-CoA:carnitine CoA-transferase CaiB-like acyl-CoA transferase n=1 Tax=Streptosporangium brasiliense TaxID=47480 RepID=A0ABT9R761_9ACTN|nr:hypothetical protein [Streptosporangium brasiliense]MDP9864711.1 crotonobetainyl-CoA:carnitine CoA-transferase CaiB-like acyl-CoA transferase [Streptosporangium brasiliense]
MVSVLWSFTPAVVHYVEHPTAGETGNLAGRFRAQVLDVLRVDDGRITAIASFEPRHFAAFGLPLACCERGIPVARGGPGLR